MKKFFVLFLLFVTGFLSANDPKIRFSGEMKTQWEYIDMNVFQLQLKGGARYEYENLKVVTELKARYSLCSDYDSFSFDISQSYFNYAFTDHINATIGRDKLSNLFESEVQYGEKFNGVALAFEFDRLNVKTAAFIPGIHGYYSGCGQVQIQPFDFPLMLTYSLIFWDSQQACSDQFLISQVSCKLSPTGKLMGVPIMLIGGWAINDRAKTEATACYAGIELGNIYPQYKHDWRITSCYKRVGNNSIPHIDRQDVMFCGHSCHGIAVEAIYFASDRLSFKGATEVVWIEESCQDRLNSYSFEAMCKF